MQVTRIPLSELRRPEKNIRIHTDKQIKEFERSVQMFGQIRPIVVDENNTILAGNGLYETLLKMGASEADVYKLTDLTDNQKKKLMIADNKVFNLGIDDLSTLNTFLDELQDDLDIPGFDESILQSMTAEAEEITEKLSEYGTLNESDIENIKGSHDRKEELIQKAESQEAHSSNRINDIESGSTAEARKCVTCPKCGEKIWL